MRKIVSVVAAAAFGFGTPAMAQDKTPTATTPQNIAAAGSALAVGTVVYDPQGGEVGKIVAVANSTVVIDTGANKATIDRASIGTGKTGAVIGYTRAQLDAAIAAASSQTAAALTAALVPGAEIKSQDGVVIGKVAKLADDGVVVVERLNAPPVSLPRDALAVRDGVLALLFTAAQFEAALGQSGAPAPATAATSTLPSAR